MTEESDLGAKRIGEMADGSTASLEETEWLAKQHLKLLRALQRCSDNDLTAYEPRAPRRDNKTPDQATPPGSTWLTPRQIADIAMAGSPAEPGIEAICEVTILIDTNSSIQGVYINGELKTNIMSNDSHWLARALADAGVFRGKFKYTFIQTLAEMPTHESDINEEHPSIPLIFRAGIHNHGS